MYLTFGALKNNIEFSLAPSITLIWLTVKTTQCMIIRKTLCYDLFQTICKLCAKKIGSFRLTVSEDNYRIPRLL